MISLNPIKAAAAPYLVWIKLGAIVAILLAAFTGGCTVQKKFDAGVIAKKDTALHDAANSLRAAGTALREINQEAARRIAEAKKNEKAARDAEVIAHEAAQRIAVKAMTFESKLSQARKKASCDALLNMDIAKECGL